MAKRLFAGFTVLLGIFMYAAYPYFLALESAGLRDKLEKAAQSYLFAEKSKSLGQRKEGFNTALKIWMELEREWQPYDGNGEIYYNIANANYQLAEYPWAIYYYYRALALNPRNVDASSNLKIAQEKLSLLSSQENQNHQPFLFHRLFSLPERLVGFALFTFGTLAFASCLVWFPGKMLKALFAASSFASLLFLASCLYSRYVEPIEAVLIHPAVLYRDAGTQYAKVKDEPLQAGLKVEVLEVDGNGVWLKVRLADGIFGFLSGDAVRLI